MADPAERIIEGKEIVRQHPMFSDYKGVEGNNIERGWEDKANCRITETPVEIFYAKRPMIQRDDILVCDGCEVMESCLLDSLAQGDLTHKVQGRRAFKVENARKRIDQNVREVLGTKHVRDSKRRYPGGQSAEEFYGSDPVAADLVAILQDQLMVPSTQPYFRKQAGDEEVYQQLRTALGNAPSIYD